MPEINQVQISTKYELFSGLGISSTNGIIEGDFTGFRHLLIDCQNKSPTIIFSMVLTIAVTVERERWVTFRKDGIRVGVPPLRRTMQLIDLLDNEYFKSSISYSVNSESPNFDLALILLP